MLTVGLDLSINSTGISIWDEEKQDATYYIITHKLTKKQQAFSHKYISYILYNKSQPKEDDSYIDKEYVKTMNIYSITNAIKDILKPIKKKVRHCCIEGVSYGSVGSAALIDLSGLNYMVRQMLLEMGILFWIVSPTQNKKFAVANGSADKDVMIEAWKRCDKNIRDIKDIKIDDLADAYFLSRFDPN